MLCCSAKISGVLRMHTIKYHLFVDLVSCQQKKTREILLLFFLFFFLPVTVASGISPIFQIIKKKRFCRSKHLEILLGIWQEQVDWSVLQQQEMRGCCGLHGEQDRSERMLLWMYNSSTKINVCCSKAHASLLHLLLETPQSNL